MKKKHVVKAVEKVMVAYYECGYTNTAQKVRMLILAEIDRCDKKRK